jgi:hypothetical protein
MSKKIILLFILALGLSACGQKQQGVVPQAVPSAPEQSRGNGPLKALLSVDEDGYTGFDSAFLEQSLSANPKTSLNEEEKKSIAFMLEEEKLARDVYAKMFEKWTYATFDRVSASEHTHVSAVRALADKYGVDVSFYKNDLGEFTNPSLRELYSTLSKRGEASLVEALKVAAEIEELDIKDLEAYRAESGNADIILVYDNLMRASRNHLRAFVRQVLRQQGSYSPQKLSQEQFDSIINSPNESGRE